MSTKAQRTALAHLTRGIADAAHESEIQRWKADPSQGNWYPANGGTEEPFTTRDGFRLLYCYQPSTGNHGWLDLGTDMILSREEERNLLRVW